MASQKSKEIIEEMVQFSVDVIEKTKKLDLPRSVSNQLVRATTSIGANFTEAQDASSKKDFINKIYIAKKEASETKYWLSVVAKLSPQKEHFDDLTDKAHRYVMMFQKIINSSRGNNRK